MNKIIILISFFFYACAPKFEVAKTKLTKNTVEETITTINSGTIEALKEAELSFGTIGRIKKIHTTLGEKVSEGKVLAELENEDLKIIFQDTEKELSRSVELFKNGLISTSALDMIKKEKEIAKSNYEKTIIKAPFSGMVTALELKIGEFYQTTKTDTKPLIKLIDLSKRMVKGDIDEVDLFQVKNGLKARVRVPAMKKAVFNAKVSKVVPFVSTAKDQDRTSQIILEIEESNELIPVGASADVEIIVNQKDNAWTLPSNAVLGLKGKKYVFKIIDNKTIKADVKIGLANYEKTEILEGISENDEILLPGDKYDMAENLKVK